MTGAEPNPVMSFDDTSDSLAVFGRSRHLTPVVSDRNCRQIPQVSEPRSGIVHSRDNRTPQRNRRAFRSQARPRRLPVRMATPTS